MTMSNSILPQTRSYLVVISCIHTTSPHVRCISSMDSDKYHADISAELRVREIEIATHVPKKFRFPYFAK